VRGGEVWAARLAWKSKDLDQSLSEHGAKSLQKDKIILLPGELCTSTKAFSFLITSEMKPGMISRATSSMPASAATSVLDSACSRQKSATKVACLSGRAHAGRAHAT